ncbi:MAG: hypothetical protein MUC88_26750 [Planctomycetes bacterium]|jgi:hypothetical protein|nr:hypothetical protein [Planctomycetota bacterium]
MGPSRVKGTEGLEIQAGVSYNEVMLLVQSIVVATLVSVLYLYLRQSNQD